jgi:acyl-CoA thioester hydrolase
MIEDSLQIRPRYGEVDKMGYVYHANHVCYCHQARTELLRKLGIHDSMLESNNIMLPVINFSIQYKFPAHYDEILTVKTTIREIPKVRLVFYFEIVNDKKQLICTAESTVVFVDSKSRYPQPTPDFVKKAIKNEFDTVCQ